MQESPITAADDGIRLDRWFRRHLPEVPHALLEKSLRRGLVRLDGKKATSSSRITTGQMLRYPSEWSHQSQSDPLEPARTVSAEDRAWLESLVLYENEHLLALNKPPGLAVQGGSKLDRNLDDLLEGLRREGDREKPKLVHRLDRDTSGVLLVARTARAAAELARQFADKSIRKTYQALVRGVPEPRSGLIALPLRKAIADGQPEGQERVRVDLQAGQEAETEYRVIQSAQGVSWLELQPLTGRTHQLRVHLAWIGHPILGDGKYGGVEAFISRPALSRRLHLHAARLELADCFGQRLDVCAPLPEHMRQTLQRLGIASA